MPRARIRTAAAAVALTLIAFGTTACSSSDDDCDDQALSLVPVAVSAPLRPGPATRGRVSKPAPRPKARPAHHGGTHHHTTVYTHCEEED